ncbi:MAG: lysylphosphatidylglycerol synthase transmembrane domain-containing protein [Pseudomonadota bacterium]
MTIQWIKLAVSALCLGALLWWTDAAGVFARLRGADMAWVTLALVAITAATFAMASRWKLTTDAFGLQIRFPTALREYYLAQLINTLVPGGVAGDVTRAVRARHGADLTRAAQSVMAERLLGQIAILGLMFAGFAVALLVPGGPDWGALGWIIPSVLTGGLVTFCVLLRGHNATARFLRVTLHLMRRPAITVHGIATTFCLILGFYACARATGVIIPAEGWATLIPLVLCAMLIPLSVAGWGWREGAAAALFPFIGAPADAGIASSITYGLVLFVAALPAAGLLITQNVFRNASSKRKPNIL